MATPPFRRPLGQVKVGTLISLRLTRFLSILAYAGRWKRYYKVAKLRGWHPFGRAKPASITRPCWGYTRTGWGYTRTGWGYTRTGWGYTRTGYGYTRTAWGYIDPDLDGLGYRAPQNSQKIDSLLKKIVLYKIFYRFLCTKPVFTRFVCFSIDFSRNFDEKLMKKTICFFTSALVAFNMATLTKHRILRYESYFFVFRGFVFFSKKASEKHAPNFKLRFPFKNH